MEQKKNDQLVVETERIVLPGEVRQVMGWDPKTPVEIWLNVTNEEVVIRKHLFTCICCGKAENLKRYDKQYICTACQKEIARL